MPISDGRLPPSFNNEICGRSCQKPRREHPIRTGSGKAEKTKRCMRRQPIVQRAGADCGCIDPNSAVAGQKFEPNFVAYGLRLFFGSKNPSEIRSRDELLQGLRIKQMHNMVWIKPTPTLDAGFYQLWGIGEALQP